MRGLLWLLIAAVCALVRQDYTEVRDDASRN